MRLIFLGLTGIVLGAMILISTEARAMSKEPQAGRLLLRCEAGPGGDPVDPAFCAAVAETLRAAQTRPVLTGTAPAGAGDLALSLEVDRFTDRGITARLVADPARAPARAPLGFDVMDRSLSPQMIRQFAADLVAAHADLF